MSDGFSDWLLNLLSITSVITFLAYVFRDMFSKLFSKAIENRFEKQMESFKAEIRENENELHQIRSFLATAQRERDSAIQRKRLDAAENLLRARQSLSQLSILVEYMKVLNTDQMLEEADDPRIADFIKTLLEPFDLEAKLQALGAIDKTVPRLYLSERSLKAFDAYEAIILQAAMMMRLLSIPLRDKGKLIKSGYLGKIVTELFPTTKEGFDKWGDGFAYYWSTYFHDEVLKSLRQEISGADDMQRDAESVQKLAMDSRRAQINIRSSLDKAGLPDTLLKSDESATASSSVVEKITATFEGK